MSAWFSAWILKLLGWKVLGIERISSLPQYVVIVAPHTSNWDFPLGILVRTAFHLQKIRFLGKASLFRFPFGWIFRALGGFPVQRDKSHNLVESYVKVFQTNSDFAIVIAPEGTRKKVDHFKTGFYYIAKGADIPIVLCKFDYHERVVDFMEVFVPGTEESADLAYIESRFRGARGKNREYNF